MSVILKKKIEAVVNPTIIQSMPALREVVQEFQRELKISRRTVITIKEKRKLWKGADGSCFNNKKDKCISCHIFIHRHSHFLTTIVIIAHEMVHAWQIDSGKPFTKGWENEAEQLSLSLVQPVHQRMFPDREPSLIAFEVELARYFL